MNDRDVRRYERATRVQTFGRNNAADFAAGSKAKIGFTKLDGLIRQLDDAKAGQLPNRVSKETLVDSLMLDLKNISRTAREIEKSEAGFAAPYRIPDNPAEIAITAHADSVLASLEDQAGDSATTKADKAALRARFVEYELPADFVANLRTDRDAITGTTQHNQVEDQDGMENTALIGKLLGQANEQIVQLHAIVLNKYTRQSEKLRVWQSVSHVERAPHREKEDGTPVTPPSTPGPK